MLIISICVTDTYPDWLSQKFVQKRKPSDPDKLKVERKQAHSRKEIWIKNKCSDWTMEVKLLALL